MSLRILLCTHAVVDPQAAVYRSFNARAEHLAAHGHHVEVFTPEDLMATRPTRLDPFTLPVALACRRLRQYDVVVFHSYLGWVFHIFRWWFDPGRRVTTITVFHGLEPLYFDALSRESRRFGPRLSLRFRLLHAVVGRLLKLSSRRSDALFCLNSTEAAYLGRHGWAEPSRILQMMNGVEDACFVHRSQRGPARRLLFVGQWLPAKGIRYLVEAMSILSETEDLELACVGTRVPAEIVLESFPSALRTRVQVLPTVQRSQLHDELSKADLFVFPSLSEGFSFALLEAMAAGLPIVTTPAGAAVDMLRHGHNAMVVPFSDTTALVTAVRQALGDPGLRERLGRAARTTAMRYTSQAANVQFLTRVLAVVSRKSRAGAAALIGDDVVS